MDYVVDATGGATIQPTGELDLETIPPLRQVVDTALAAGSRSITIDLRHVTFLDSSALALFAQAALRAESVTLTNASPLVRRVVEGTGLDTILNTD